MSQVLFHCPCLSPLSVSKPPPTEPPLSTYYHHPLSTLLFCEECDAIRCDTCSQQEITCFFCPNCLFEVPSASVRGEKNRCARNCFQCPHCLNTLSVVASDPPNHASLNPSSAAASIGEPPYYLACNVCKWDSKCVGIEFEKPTGLALQLQKKEEESNPSLTEFDHLKDHLEPYLRRSAAAAAASSSSPHPPPHSHSHSTTSTHLPARYGTLFSTATSSTSRNKGDKSRGGGGEKEKEKERDELEVYLSGQMTREQGGDEELKEFMRSLKDWEDVTELKKRWKEGWRGGDIALAASLKPLRTPLHTKKSKRCPICKHILIKPEQKSSSTRFKIKLVASNYLPSIELYRRPPTTIGSRLSAIAAGTASGMRRSQRTALGGSGGAGPGAGTDEEPLRPGRTYTFELSFVNPLYEPIHVRLAVARPTSSSSTSSIIPTTTGAATTTPTPPYAVNLPSPNFPISAYAEEWEYEDDEEFGNDKEFDEEEEDGGGGGGAGEKRRKKGSGGSALPGVVERKMNRTTVLMDVAVGRDTVGPIRANMLVTYVYQSDDSITPPSPTKSPVKKGTGTGAGFEKDGDVKSFSFWTLFTLGTVLPRVERSERSEARRSMGVGSSVSVGSGGSTVTVGSGGGS